MIILMCIFKLNICILFWQLVGLKYLRTEIAPQVIVCPPVSVFMVFDLYERRCGALLQSICCITFGITLQAFGILIFMNFIIRSARNLKLIKKTIFKITVRWVYIIYYCECFNTKCVVNITKKVSLLETLTVNYIIITKTIKVLYKTKLSVIHKYFYF